MTTNEVEEQHFKCFGPCKEILPESAFPHHTQPYKGKRYRLSWCRKCRSRKYWPLRRVPVIKYRPYLNEIVFYAGSKRAAARELGISTPQLRQWMGITPRYHNSKKVYVKSISKESAAKILLTLRRLRQNARRAA